MRLSLPVLSGSGHVPVVGRARFELQQLHVSVACPEIVSLKVSASMLPVVKSGQVLGSHVLRTADFGSVMHQQGQDQL